MKFIFDHDLHIHSQLSFCSDDPNQTTQDILNYAKSNNLKTICITDHYWDNTIPMEYDWYRKQDFEHISKSLPLPQDKNIKFLFGAECEFDKDCKLSIPKEKYDCFDFFVIPTTHLHMWYVTEMPENIDTPEKVAKVWVKRLDALLNMDLPFHKIGIAHLACTLITPKHEDYIKALSLIEQSDLDRLFARCAKLGVGIEINKDDITYEPEDEEIVMRIFKTAKKQGCKFYLGSDSHHPENFVDAAAVFEKAINYLNLTEEDKFILK